MTLYVVTGPPASGKTTWVKENAKPGNITIDLDAIMATLTPGIKPYDPPRHILDVAIIARQAAINASIRWSQQTNVYIIHSAPTHKHLAAYRRYQAQIITIDPGQQVCMERVRDSRPSRQLEVVQQWYAQQHTTANYAKADW